MLHRVEVGRQRFGRDARSAGEEAIDRARELATDPRGLRVLHLNATPYSGGVAEILRSEVPVLRDLGLRADWQPSEDPEGLDLDARLRSQAERCARRRLLPRLRADELTLYRSLVSAAVTTTSGIERAVGRPAP